MSAVLCSGFVTLLYLNEGESHKMHTKSRAAVCCAKFLQTSQPITKFLIGKKIFLKYLALLLMRLLFIYMCDDTLPKVLRKKDLRINKCTWIVSHGCHGKKLSVANKYS